jgi:lipoate-protein ligase A
VQRFFDGPLSTRENGERDAGLLRAGRRAVRVGVLNDRALSIGVAQSVEGPSARRAEQRSIPVVRRSTGGTGLLHQPGDLTWAIVLPRNDPLVGRDFVSAYPRLGAGVTAFLAERGVQARWSPPIDVAEPYCLLGPRGQVLLTGGKALGGAAQHLSAQALLHHGVLNGPLDRPLLTEVFDLEAGVAERYITGLSEVLAGVAADELGRSLLEHLARAADPALSPER